MTTIATTLEVQEYDTLMQLAEDIYTSKQRASGVVGNQIITYVRDIDGADDVTELWPIAALLDPIDMCKTVHVGANGETIYDVKALTAAIVERVAEEAARLKKAQALPPDGYRHYVKTRELPRRVRRVASVTPDMAAKHPYLGKPFDKRLRLPPGAYVCVISDVAPDPDHDDQIVIYWDVAEGYYAGCFDRLTPDKYPKQMFLRTETINCNTKAHQSTEYKITALDMSNPRCDAKTYIKTGDWGQLIGKKFGAVLFAEDYPSAGGPRVRSKLRNWIPVQDVPNTPIPEPVIRHGYAGPIPEWPEGARGWD